MSPRTRGRSVGLAGKGVTVGDGRPHYSSFGMSPHRAMIFRIHRRRRAPGYEGRIQYRQSLQMPVSKRRQESRRGVLAIRVLLGIPF
jgi:hypothetical protein